MAAPGRGTRITGPVALTVVSAKPLVPFEAKRSLLAASEHKDVGRESDHFLIVYAPLRFYGHVGRNMNGGS